MSLEVTLCRAGEVLTGQLKLPACPEFGRRCTLEHPLGAPMVSSEGAWRCLFPLLESPSFRQGLLLNSEGIMKPLAVD